MNRVDLWKFDNGWSISVINGHGTYADGETFEVAVLNPDGELCYAHTNGDVLGWQSTDEIEVLKQRIKQL